MKTRNTSVTVRRSPRKHTAKKQIPARKKKEKTTKTTENHVKGSSSETKEMDLKEYLQQKLREMNDVDQELLKVEKQVQSQAAFLKKHYPEFRNLKV